MRYAKPNMLVQFSVVSAVVLAAIGLALTLFLSSRLELTAIDEVINHIETDTSVILTKALNPADLKAPLVGERFDRLDEVVRRFLISDLIALVKVWGADGSLIYTSDPLDIEAPLLNEPLLSIALTGTTSAHLHHAEPAGSTLRQTDLLEVYAPIQFPGDSSVHGAVEIYQYYAPTLQHIAAMRSWISMAIGTGFLLLYGSLVSIAWRGSRTIKRQQATIFITNESLRELNTALKVSRDNLERRVEGRTVDLSKANETLLASEQALKESEERYRALVNLRGEVGEAIVMCQDTEQGEAIHTFVNEQWPYITGYSRDELLGMSFFDLVHPKDRKPSLERHRRKMRGESLPGLFELSIIRKDGAEIPIELTSAHTTYQGEHANVAFIRDITERKKAEETLRKSEENLRAYVEGAPDGVFISDLKGTFLYGNKKAEEITGYKREELAGKSFLKLNLLPAKQLAEAGKLLALNAIGRATGPDEIELIRKDGSRIWTEITTTPIKQEEKVVVVGFVRDITERKQAEEEQERLISASQEQNQIIVSMNSELERALTKSRQAEEALRFSDVAFKSIQESVVTTDTEHNITHWNEASERMYKIKASEAIGKKLCDVIEIVEASPDETAERLRKLETRGYYRAEVLHRTKYAELWVNLSIQVIESDGKRNGWVTLATDITERRRAEKVIHMMAESTARITDQAFFQDMAHALCEWLQCEVAIVGEVADDSTVRTLATQVDGKIADKSSYALRGTPCENVVTEGFCYYPENVASLFPEDKSLARLQLSGYVGVPLLNKRGDALGVLCAMSRAPMKLPEQTEEMMSMFAARAAGEIERKKAEATLLEHENQFRTSVENMLDCFGIYSAIRDDSGRIVDFQIEYVNEAACASNRMTREEQVGKRLCELLPAHRETGLFDEYCQVVGTGKPLIKESLLYEDVHKEQRLIRAFDIRAVKLRDGFAVAWRDITERRQMEEQLRHSQLLASLGEMTAGIAHEVGNPLASILLYSEVAMKNDVSRQTRKDLKVIHEEAKHAGKLIRSLLAYSRKLTTHRRRLNLHSTIKKVLDMRQYQHKVQNISTSTKLRHSPLYVNGDSSQLTQVFINLVLNAEEALKESEGGNIVITTQMDGEWARVSIADDGSGIPQKDLGRVFHPFFTTKEVGEGTGLGLSTCYGIVTAHGGLIRAESNEAGGATFTVELPLTKTRRQDSLL